MIMPDFDEWAKNLISGDEHKYTDLRLSLKQAFDQGYHLGLREGYDEGLNKGWADNMDKEYKDKEGGQG